MNEVMTTTPWCSPTPSRASLPQELVSLHSDTYLMNPLLPEDEDETIHPMGLNPPVPIGIRQPVLRSFGVTPPRL